MIGELAKESEGQFKCLGEKTEIYITFSVPIKNDNSENYKLKFIDSLRFMSTSVSNLIDNLSEKFHSDKCTYFKSCLDYMSVKDNQLIFKCSKYNKNNNKDLNEDLIIRFASTYSGLKMEGITDIDYRHTKKMFKELKMNNLG